MFSFITNFMSWVWDSFFEENVDIKDLLNDFNQELEEQQKKLDDLLKTVEKLEQIQKT